MVTIFKSGISIKSWLCSLLLIGLWQLPAQAQSIRLARHLNFASTAAVSLDRMGNFYFADQRRTVYKFSPDGELITTFSPRVSGTVSSIEARNGVKILVFYYDQQRMIVLDRFLREMTSVSLAKVIDQGGNDIIKAVTFSADDQLWIFNESNFTLSKVDARTYKPFFETPMSLIVKRKSYDVRFMREYQNNLYVVEKSSGIYVFDNMGNYKKIIPFPDLEYVGFQGDEMYYLKDNQLNFFHLYNGQMRTVPIAGTENYTNALVGDKFIYLFSDQGVDLFEIE